MPTGGFMPKMTPLAEREAARNGVAIPKPSISGPAPVAPVAKRATPGEIAIDDGIPVPEDRRSAGRTERYPFSKLKVGQSFFVPGIKTIGLTAVKKRTGFAFVLRQVEGGVRVWRTA